MKPWAVEDYSIERLRALFDEPCAANQFADTVHDVYFEEYFETIGAKSIVVERDYIDHDFLEDFAAYYVRCFQPYARTCTRLHFFHETIKTVDVEQMLGGSPRASKKLARSYLGFIVVRPVPQRPVGRTCLVTYDSEGEREYPCLRQYDANLFGLPLSVRSLAFQQQDKAVAACATSALWAAFQVSGKLFGHRIPSPAAITANATRRIPLDTRTLPASSGLTAEQMADAIRACDLEPVLVGCRDARDLRAAVYGYAGAGIPLVLVGVVEGESEDPPPRHAVTITGYRLGATARFEGLVSDRLSKLYAHDDAVGPFARMDFIEGEAALLTTSIADGKHNIGKQLFRPELVLVPVYHKIRIPFDRVLREILSLNFFLDGLRAAGLAMSKFLPSCDWDIRLRTVNDYKVELRASASTSMSVVLERGLPRFLWVARATHEAGGGFDLLFDATGIESDNLCVLRVDRGSPVPQTLREAAIGAETFVGAEGVASRLLA
ncbi:MAG: hypothetical protein KF819_37995 [Labilithrix sp.]|nr:hypothetical protein [Labilithrix sp.]